MAERTTVEVSLETWKRLNERKNRPGESFDEVIAELLDSADDDPDGGGGGGDEESDTSDDAPTSSGGEDEFDELDLESDRNMLDILEDWEPGHDVNDERARAAAERAVAWLEEQDGPRTKQEFIDALATESELSDRIWWERAVRPALRELVDHKLIEYRAGHHDYSK